MRKQALGWRHPFSPYARISQVPLQTVQQALVAIFERRNKPGSCRVDNGQPFGTPSNDLPSALALWLIGHDIDLIWNKPYCPQMNGVVEKMQDTSQRWAEIGSAHSYQELQQRLDDQARVQRQVYPVTRLQHQTRLQVYPTLEKSERVWAAAGFDAQRVYNFLAQRVFPRKVSQSGQITHGGQKISGLSAYRGRTVHVKLDAKTLQWHITHEHISLKSVDAAQTLSAERLLCLSTFQGTADVTSWPTQGS